MQKAVKHNGKAFRAEVERIKKRLGDAKTLEEVKCNRPKGKYRGRVKCKCKKTKQSIMKNFSKVRT